MLVCYNEYYLNKIILINLFAMRRFLFVLGVAVCFARQEIHPMKKIEFEKLRDNPLKIETQVESDNVPTAYPTMETCVSLLALGGIAEYIGDGYCDPAPYNTLDCAWDGGDCCVETCKDNTYKCGSNGFTGCHLYITAGPSVQPTEFPNALDPTFQPTISLAPSLDPSVRPTAAPTFHPSPRPTRLPTTLSPTEAPVTDSPTFIDCPKSVIPAYLGDGYCDPPPYNSAACGWDGGDCCASTCINSTYICGHVAYDCHLQWAEPTVCPTAIPSRPTLSPSARPTRSPSLRPTVIPTELPSESPTDFPTFVPTVEPTQLPTAEPSAEPSRYPTSSEPTSFAPSQLGIDSVLSVFSLSNLNFFNFTFQMVSYCRDRSPHHRSHLCFRNISRYTVSRSYF